MRVKRNWIVMLGGLALLTLALSAAPPRLSVSHREAAVERATPGTRVTLFDGAPPIGATTADPSGRAGFGELHLSPGDHGVRALVGNRDGTFRLSYTSPFGRAL
jgi:hypothetical protein